MYGVEAHCDVFDDGSQKKVYTRARMVLMGVSDKKSLILV